MKRPRWSSSSVKPSSFQLIILCFIATILLGALLLMLPVSSKSRSWTSFEEALFTSVSALCVTGLAVVDTARYWSIFGQSVILVLIQLGGVGVISVAAFIASVSGKKISLLQRSMLQDAVSAHQIGGIESLVRFIVITTLAIELAGAIIMLPTFIPAFGAKGIWMALFHSISAFCNAGFDIMGESSGEFTSLLMFRSNAGVMVPVSLLIVIGGIGFLTWQDVAKNRLNFKRYRMQSKVIITTTLILILLPALFLFFTEFSQYPIKERFFLSMFISITPRTAGFSTIDISSMNTLSQSVTAILMLIGGSPGSTAGGIKTTTLAVLISNIVAVMYRGRNPSLYGRRIEDITVKSASALLLMYIVLSFVGAGIISAHEGLPLSCCIFETISAIGTVGLSLGITAEIGALSHSILMFLMFFGRVGGLTLMFAALSSREGELYRYPVEKITVG